MKHHDISTMHNKFLSKRTFVIAGSVLLIVVVAGITMLSRQRQAGATTAAQARTVPALTVSIVKPVVAMWDETLTASGAIAPWQEAIIGSQIGGYQLAQVLVNVGDRVKKGQTLARLNPDLLLAEEAQLRAAYEQADANAKRATSLQGSGGISDQDVLQATTQSKTALAQLAFKKLQLSYTNVVAPEDGVISARTATLGAVTATGQELFRMIVRERLEWRGEATAEQLARIVRGQRIALTLPGGGLAKAIVRQTAPSLDTASRMGLIYADISDNGTARAGMYANGAIALPPIKALVVPAQSVVIRDGHSYALVLRTDGSDKVDRRIITTGRLQGNHIEITEGVTTNDNVVVAGAGFLNDGDTVRVAVPAPPAKSVAASVAASVATPVATAGKDLK
ncbi:efflux RND transporter periplasmic adaptor subunit [Herbaspirillum sp. RTI4]|uniref:efflux RND transporter periplasmic adaptor subunit n=1 Tax=Herbaspirillum sp. RTI4 TaxID=3048640 RepID=UPI002AB3DB4D|nr:efflux RND transporter periplasmic adaptor subunit [Herbaspirillum sp. RTI4]MDY7579284.1 efflux RND transporter periplasmic adaptor subunit [Herbaspirillum sp. RTI4]MEA9982783.1 efflux RND transporter periplasmic adaptor subunit [Herbaspirillum sp. RTI4]